MCHAVDSEWGSYVDVSIVRDRMFRNTAGLLGNGVQNVNYSVKYAINRILNTISYGDRLYIKDLLGYMRALAAAKAEQRARGRGCRA